ncbi:hypothetical protein [Nocardia sp. NPDC020380]|uniref:hypothetical protein n=1 Tax=Nocardia sp. NPDC020380 TaxID=3364309 RepID=UPI0037A33F09
MHEFDQALPPQVDGQPDRTTPGIGRWVAAGLGVGLATGLGGGAFQAWQAWRPAHPIGADLFAGITATTWDFTTVIPVVVGLTAALAVGAPTLTLFTARQSTPLRMWTIAATLITLAAVVLWPLAAAWTSTVSLETIQLLSGVDPNGHYWPQLILAPAALWWLIESIAFALTLFGLHTTIRRRTNSDQRRKLTPRVLLATIALTLVFSGVFAAIAHQTNGQLIVHVVPN